MARPTKLTKALADKIITLIRAGNYVETAAAMHGIHKSTFYDWLKKGARLRDEIEAQKRKRLTAKQKGLLEFSDAVKSARAEAEVRLLNNLSAAAAAGQWQASAWRLERMWPNRYARPKERIELSGDPDSPVEVEHSAEVIRELAKTLREDADYVAYTQRCAEDYATQRLRLFSDEGGVGTGPPSNGDRRRGNGKPGGNGAAPADH